MKQFITLLFLLLSLTTFAQKNKGGYFSFRGGAAFKDDITKGIAHISVGYSDNHIFGIGAGIGFIEFEKPYIPLTVDLSFFGKPDKIAPVIIGSAGYGIYNYSRYGTSVRGGFTGSLNAGVSFPVKKTTKVFLTGGYSIYSFKGGANIATANENIRLGENIKMITVTGGFKF